MFCLDGSESGTGKEPIAWCVVPLVAGERQARRSSTSALCMNVEPNRHFLFREPTYTIRGFSIDSLPVLSVSAVTDDINDRGEQRSSLPLNTAIVFAYNTWQSRL